MEVIRGTQQYSLRFFYGPIRDLQFDPNRYVCGENTPFLHYTTKAARGWVTNLENPISLLTTRWKNEIRNDLPANWRNLWHPRRARKEGAFVWSV